MAKAKNKDNEKDKVYTKVAKKQVRIFKNQDKEGWYESWEKDRDLLNFPHPFRCILSANPGSGKTNLIKNIILEAKPHFKVIYLCHYDPDTKEYNDLDFIFLDQIPQGKSNLFNPNVKTLVIIDDYDFNSLTKDQLDNLRSLFKYGSTHRGISIVVATQDFFNLPSIIRRLSNVYFIWKGSCDLDSLYQIGRRVGYTKDEFKNLIGLCHDKFDNICIDFTIDSPAKVRFNCYTPIKSELHELKAELLRKKALESDGQLNNDSSNGKSRVISSSKHK